MIEVGLERVVLRAVVRYLLFTLSLLRVEPQAPASEYNRHDQKL